MAILSLPDGPEYREVPDCPGYFAGTDGSLWKCWTGGRWPRRVPTWVRVTGTPTTSGGHLRVVMRTAAGFRVTDFLHRVVLTTFVGPCPAGTIGCHDPDPDPANCAVGNLRWATPTANSEDCKRHGRFRSGSRVRTANLSSEDVARVFAMRRAGLTHRAIAGAFGVGRVGITRVLRGDRYRDEGAARDGCPAKATTTNHARGSRHPGSKLTEQQVAEMKRLRAEGWLQKKLAERYGVTAPTVSDILRGKYWSHVAPAPPPP